MVRYLDRIVEGIETIVNGTVSIVANLIAPSAVYDGEVILPGVLPSQALKKGLTLKAAEGNVSDVLVGDFPLAPGESLPIDIDNSNKVLVTGNAGDKVYHYGS
jgi:hypothetical protein